jgi:small GTP-binding protein
VIGFENAGKTTILQKMKLSDLDPESNNSQLMQTVPTIGMSLEEIKVKNVMIKVWDLSGQLKMRNTWKYYYETVNGIIFVVDSSNKEQIVEVRETLH